MLVAHPALAIVAAMSLGAVGPAPKQARLVYDLQPGAEKCPDEEALRIAVAGRLGHSPFDSGAERAVRVSVKADSKGLAGKVELLDSAGKLLGAREIASQNRDCRELGTAMVLAIALALDPLAVASPRPAEPPPPTPPSPPPAPPPAPPPDSSTLPTMSASLGGLFSFGSTPALTGGLAVGARARWGIFSMGLEARALLPRRSAAATGSIEASEYGGSIVPCLHYWVGFGCVTAGAGAFRATGLGLENASDVVIASGEVGARLGADIPLVSGLALRVQGDLLVPLVHTGLGVGDQEVWRTPVVAGTLGLAVVWTFQTDSSGRR